MVIFQTIEIIVYCSKYVFIILFTRERENCHTMVNLTMSACLGKGKEVKPFQLCVKKHVFTLHEPTCL